MFALGAIGWLLAIIFTLISIFLAGELQKKFLIHEQFENGDGFCCRIIYRYPGGKDISKGMKTIVLTGSKPFKVLVGLKFPGRGGTDYFGQGKSFECRGGHIVVLSTFLGRRPVEFRFLIKTSSPKNVVFAEGRGTIFNPNIICLPHWWQKWGFFA